MSTKAREGTYSLSEDLHPRILISPAGVTVAHGCKGRFSYMPQEITVQIMPEESGRDAAFFVDIETLVSSYLELQSVIEGP